MEGLVCSNYFSLELKNLMLGLALVLSTFTWRTIAHSVIRCPQHPVGYKHTEAFSVPDHIRHLMLKEMELTEDESLIESNIEHYRNVIARIVSNEPNMVQKAQCEGFPGFRQQARRLRSTDRTEIKSLCPWAQDIDDHNDKRFPENIPLVKCICDKCIGVTDRKKECEPVYQYRFVLNAVEHSRQTEHHCWEKGVVKVPVGCTCTKQLTSS